MGKGQNLTEYQKIRIGECYNREYSPTMVAKVLGRPVSTITAIYSRFLMNFVYLLNRKLIDPKFAIFFDWKLSQLSIQMKRTVYAISNEN
jgi:hypothetical protein